jgi:multidrug efflux pump subunit AcrA (membrane-fusion protein)
VTPSPDASDTTSELERVKAKLDLVTEDKRRAGEKNAALNARLQELEESLRATQAQLKDGHQQKLADSGEYKKLWEDAKETNLTLERQIADLRAELDAERQARAQETLKSRALSDISTAEALRPDQLLALIAKDLREVDGKPAIITGGIEVPLSDHLARLRAPNSGWEHHFAASGARGMGSTATAPTTGAAPATNPFLTVPPNLSEIARLYTQDRATHDRLRAEATRG